MTQFDTRSSIHLAKDTVVAIALRRMRKLSPAKGLKGKEYKPNPRDIERRSSRGRGRPQNAVADLILPHNKKERLGGLLAPMYIKLVNLRGAYGSPRADYGAGTGRERLLFAVFEYGLHVLLLLLLGLHLSV